MVIGQAASGSGFNDSRLRKGFFAVVDRAKKKKKKKTRRANDRTEKANKF